MSLIKLLNSSRNFLTLLGFTTFLCLSVIAEEKSVDIWNNKNQTKPEKNNIQQEPKQEPKIDISKLNQNQNESIKISESETEESDVKLIGLYDPGQNDLSLEMWMRTNGELIKQSIKRI